MRVLSRRRSRVVSALIVACGVAGLYDAGSSSYHAHDQTERLGHDAVAFAVTMLFAFCTTE